MEEKVDKLLKKNKNLQVESLCSILLFSVLPYSSHTESTGKWKTVPGQMHASIIYFNQILRAHSSVSFPEH